MKLNKSWRKAITTLLVGLIIGSSSIGIVWATCFETPYDQTPQSHCNLAGDYYEYTPDPPINCGLSGNPFDGCQNATQPLIYDIYHYYNADCTDYTGLWDGPYLDGNVERDTAYVCCD